MTRTVEPFLAVMDNFQLALKAEGSAEQLKQGVEMILRQMEGRTEGLERAAGGDGRGRRSTRASRGAGERGDEGVSGSPGDGGDPPRYQIRDKLLRPALVRIASNPAQVSD